MREGVRSREFAITAPIDQVPSLKVAAAFANSDTIADELAIAKQRSELLKRLAAVGF